MIFPHSIPFTLASLAGTTLYAFRTSDWFGKSIVIILVIGSVFAWTVILTKMREFKRAEAESRRFLGAYRREGHPLALFFQNRVHYGPLYGVYDDVCKGLGSALGARGEPSELFGGRAPGGGSHVRLEPQHIDFARRLAERSTVDEVFRLEKDMGFLAVVVTAAPFLGLLGTVWGVMDAFRAMAVHGAVMLSEVAPGISGALLTTVVGLLVAIPSLIGYNLLTQHIRRLTIEMENFADELVSDIERHYGRGR